MIYSKRYLSMSAILPEGRKGGFAIEKVVALKGTWIRMYTPGGYFYQDRFSSDYPTVRLTQEPDAVWMSDTPMEQEALRVASTAARGNVLVVGLGIGLLPTMIKLRNETVKTITIIEREQSVVDLVYKHIKTARTRVVVGDASDYLYTTSERYDFIFIDVWGSLMAPLKEGELWAAIASRCLAEGGEVRWWLQELHERIKAKLPISPISQTSLPGPHDPCLVCGKKLRFDYAGLCMDCADLLEVSEGFRR